MNTMVPLRFVSLGFDYVVCASKIWMVLRADSVQGQKVIKTAKRDDRFFDFTFRRGTKSVIVMDNSMVIACAFSVKTIYNRIVRAHYDGIVYDNAYANKNTFDEDKDIEDACIEDDEDEEYVEIDDE